MQRKISFCFSQLHGTGFSIGTHSPIWSEVLVWKDDSNFVFRFWEFTAKKEVLVSLLLQFTFAVMMKLRWGAMLNSFTWNLTSLLHFMTNDHVKIKTYINLLEYAILAEAASHRKSVCPRLWQIFNLIVNHYDDKDRTNWAPEGRERQNQEA